jgi:hypothetical protein
MTWIRIWIRIRIRNLISDPNPNMQIISDPAGCRPHNPIYKPYFPLYRTKFPLLAGQTDTYTTGTTVFCLMQGEALHIFYPIPPHFSFNYTVFPIFPLFSSPPLPLQKAKVKAIPLPSPKYKRSYNYRFRHTMSDCQLNRLMQHPL